jgi:hypothetical protein
MDLLHSSVETDQICTISPQHVNKLLKMPQLLEELPLVSALMQTPLLLMHSLPPKPNFFRTTSTSLPSTNTLHTPMDTTSNTSHMLHML